MLLRALSITLTLALASPIAAAAPPPPDGLTVAAPRAPTLDALRARFGRDVEVTRDATDAVRRVSRMQVATTGRDVRERATAFVHAHAAALGWAREVRVDEARDVTAPDARVRFGIVRMTPLFEGMPIEGRTMVVRLDGQGRVTSVASDGPTPSVVMPRALVPAEAALQAVRDAFAVVAAGVPTLCVLPLGDAARVAWRVAVAGLPGEGHFIVWVDAGSGAILRQAPAAFDQRVRELPRREDLGEVVP